MNQKPAQLVLLGSPALYRGDGVRVPIHSKKALALLAMLATARRQERSRVWLQDKLWGSRGVKLAQSSLRRDVANLRRLLDEHDLDLIDADALSIRLRRDAYQCDIDDPASLRPDAEFLEGLDISGEDEFEDWLRETRLAMAERSADGGVPVSPAPLPVRSPAHAAPAQVSLAPLLVIVPPIARHGTGEGVALAEEVRRLLIDTASRFRSLALVVPDIADGEHDVATYAARYGARFVMRTEVVDSGPAMDIRVTLVEMPGEVVRWTERRRIASGTLREGNLEMEIGRAVHCVADVLERSEVRLMRDTLPDASSDPAAIAMRARWHLRLFTQDDVAAAERLVESGLASHPGDTELLMTRANVVLWRHWLARSGTEAMPAIRRVIKQAQRADPGDCRGRLFAGVVDIWYGDILAARANLLEARRLNPFYCDVLVHYGASFYLADEPASAVAPLEDALFLAPLNENRFFTLGELATVRYMLGEHDRCLALVAEIQTTHSGYILAHIIEVAALVAQGRLAEAATARTRLIDRDPALSDAMLDWIPFRNAHWPVTLRAALEAASGCMAK